MIFNLQDSICTLRKDVARIRQKRVESADEKSKKPYILLCMVFCFFHQNTTPACRVADSTRRSHISPIHNGEIDETRPHVLMGVSELAKVG